MSEIITLTDFVTATLASFEMSVAEQNLKTLCLYNDKVIVNIDNKLLQAFINQLDARYKISKKHLNEVFVSIDDIIINSNKNPRFVDIERIEELIGKENTSNAYSLFLIEEANRQEVTIERFKNDWGQMYESSKIFYYHTMSVIANLELYDAISKFMSCSITSFSKSTSIVLNSYVKCQVEKPATINVDNSIADKVEYAIPSLKELSWPQLFELRQDSRAKSFRHWINENKNEIDSTNMHNVIYREFWKVLTDIKPNVTTNIIKATLGNIPLPIPFNPFSVATGIQDIYKAKKFNEKYSWLFFFFDLHGTI